MTKSEQWQQHINLWRTSGLSQVAFCKQHNLAMHNLQYWRKRLSPGSEPVVDKPKALIPITVTSPSPARLRLGAQAIIELPTEALPDPVFFNLVIR
ncbi:IS66 family insertion sequence element accessory protein TnpA [Oceanobacter antarcticus]|uniref:Transposase n=1 Tax=Oceanobacter antarcticus TaxID=3133425 RepID=A0ABW8NLJ1_9GAMM